MFILRKIGKVLRGAATPFQIHVACLLGALLGFAPGFTKAPALVLAIVLLLLIVNANLAVAGLVGAVCKLLSFALIGVSFAAGEFLLDGPTRGLFVALINGPVTAWGGFEYYVGAGGLLLGLVSGLVFGWLVNLPLRFFRGLMGNVEDGSSFYNRYRGNYLVRFLFFVLLGSRHQWETYRKLLGRKVGNPIRIPGVVAAALVGGALWFGQRWLAEPILTAQLQSGLAAANGATADVGRVELDLANHRLAVHGVALADKHALDTDLFRATKLECDLSGTELLRGRFKLDQVVSVDATHGARRATPGELVGGPPAGAPLPPTPAPGANEKTLDEYLAEAQVWKRRLEQAREWLDQLKRVPVPGAEEGETLKERLRREAAAKGYGNVVATHLIEGAPAVAIGRFVATGIRSETLGRNVDLVVENLSTNPGLVDAAPRITLQAGAGWLTVDVGLGTEARTPGASFLAVNLVGASADALAQQIEAKTGARPLTGGTIDAGFRLGWSTSGGAAFDTPLDVVLRNTTITLPRLGAAPVKELRLPLSLRGPLANPLVKIDASRLADNLVKAGATELGNKLKATAQAQLDAATDKATEGAKEALDEILSNPGKEGGKDALKELGKDLEDLNPFGRKKKEGDR